MTCHSLTGGAPACGPDDQDTARHYMRRLYALIEQGGWPTSTRARLHRLHAKWYRRAEGLDARFVVVGNRKGALTRQERVQVQRIKERRDADR